MRQLLLLCALCLAPPTAQAECRLALALGLDVSDSVDEREYRLQLDGVADALETKSVQAALFSMPQAHVDLAVYQWGAPNQQHILVAWTTLRTSKDAADVAAQLRSSNLRFSDPTTAVGAAITFGTELLKERGLCWQHTLDISGDGPSNAGPHPGGLPRDGWITINGLVINPLGRDNIDKDLSLTQTLEHHYRTHVIRGPGSFIETAVDFDAFQQAMARKLLREVQILTVSETTTQTIPSDLQ
ncbi:DUF1194 domain-containing protein [Roseovarius pelagicus]|uniref:DUF1194 domain-containing protein n=1 Tax=Roseovarius pelagicus TaxID=2980108 RepID=A0ABY6D9X5_9RHOB|nr:DUF1194 domain-containing protein [Roseovarius pelagicus]UXX82912.1 DUF1194 domain-containing protein [Roseovarius pelagicus]